MAYLNRVLDPPSYGYFRGSKLYTPTSAEIFREFFSRLNIFKSKKNWLPFFGWMIILCLAPFFFLSFHYFSWPLFAIGFFYSMVVLGTHGTIYLHRYSTHHAFTLKNRFWLFILRNLVVKLIPEETYVVSHHVHHFLSEKPGDPYNVHGGWLYCFLADVNHQSIAKDFSKEDYEKTAALVRHTGMGVNNYEQYQKWGSIAHPLRTLLQFLSNWIFWFGAFYLVGGIPLAVTLFGWSAVWAVGVRTFNYDGHGGGKDKRREGIDFNRADLSINQLWPGLVTGEWHNNHHLYPNGIRAGFLPYQWDYAWLFICFYRWLGAVDSARDYKAQFLTKYYEPYLRAKESAKTAATHART
ncbi:MAG TPA: fatty acid desaturase [bacterium]|nr:fatty acid desaturase [bacterium]